MIWKIVSYGEKVAAINLEEMGQRAMHARPAFEQIYLTILDIEDEMFDRSGARGQAEWLPISIETINRKVRDGLSPEILQATGDLRASLTQYRHHLQSSRIEQTKIVFSSRRPFARLHQEGKGGMTKRRFIHFTRADHAAFAREIVRYVRGRRTPLRGRSTVA